MPGIQPPHEAHSSPPRLNALAAAAAEMMWAVALATTRAAVVSTAHSLALWSQMLLRAPALYPPVGPWSIARGSLLPGPNAGAPPAEAPAQDVTAAAPAEGPAFASYRSSGGHAAAQVTKPH